MTLSQLISEYKNLVLLYRLLTILHLLDSKQKSIKLEGNEDSIPSDPSLKKKCHYRYSAVSFYSLSE